MPVRALRPERSASASFATQRWERGRELHPQPSGYGPDALLLRYPASSGGPEAARTLNLTRARGVLSLLSYWPIRAEPWWWVPPRFLGRHRGLGPSYCLVRWRQWLPSQGSNLNHPASEAGVLPN